MTAPLNTRSASVARPAPGAGHPETNPPRNLRDCGTDGEKLGWIKRRLEAGETLTGTGLWMAGIRNGGRLIDALRRGGMFIEDCLIDRADSSGRVHQRTPAWRLGSEA